MAKKRRSARKSARKVCVTGASCPGGFKHTVSIIAFFVLIYYAQMLLGISGNLWVSSLILVVLGYLSLKWCPLMDKCC